MEFKIWIGLALLVVSIQPRQVYSSRSHRHRRALLQMFSQLVCERGDCHPYRYLGHGCYCGAGGRGPPLDDIDECCRQHDNCYNKISTLCTLINPFINNYGWKCISGQSTCHSFKSKNDCIHQLCNCDKVFSSCIQRYPCPVHRKNKLPLIFAGSDPLLIQHCHF